MYFWKKNKIRTSLCIWRRGYFYNILQGYEFSLCEKTRPVYKMESHTLRWSRSWHTNTIFLSFKIWPNLTHQAVTIELTALQTRRKPNHDIKPAYSLDIQTTRKLHKSTVKYPFSQIQQTLWNAQGLIQLKLNNITHKLGSAGLAE